MSSLLSTWILTLFAAAQEPELGAPSEPQAPAASATQEELPEGESRMIALSELEEAAAGTDVTVLFVFQKAEAVSASSSVSRSFQNQRAIRVQADARSNSVFISGAAELVREAVTRMQALDDATPEPQPRPVRQKPGPAEGPMSVVEDYGADATQATSRAGFLIAGLVGLAVVGILLARRLVG